MMQSCCIAYWLVGELRQHFAGCTVFTVRDHKNLQEYYKMESTIREIGGQIVECSNGKIVITAAVKGEKEWQDWLQDFQLKSNSAWTVRNTFPSCNRATFRKDYVCQHSDYNKAVHSNKRSKNTVCRAKLSVRIKPVTANTRTKDKYVKV